MQNLILMSDISNANYVFKNSKYTVSSFEEAVYVLFNNVYVNKDDVLSEEFVVFIEKLKLFNISKILRNNKLNKNEKIFDILKSSNMFLVEECEEVVRKLEIFEQKEKYEQYKIIAKELINKNISISIKYYKKSVSEKIDFENIVALGYLYKATKDYEKAVSYFSIAKELGNNSKLTENLIECLLKTNRLEQAKEEIANNETKISQEVYFESIADVCFLEKDYESQISFYKEAFYINKSTKLANKIIDFYITHRQFRLANEFMDSIEVADTSLVLKRAELIRLNENAKKACDFLLENIKNNEQDIKIFIKIAEYKRISYDEKGTDYYINKAKEIDENDRELLLEIAKSQKAKGQQNVYLEKLNDLLELHKREYKIST